MVSGREGAGLLLLFQTVVETCNVIISVLYSGTWQFTVLQY